jgi:multidrug efflux pump subunit AcrB
LSAGLVRAAIVGTALRHPRITLALAALILVAGLVAAAGARYVPLPVAVPPVVTIRIPAAGLSPAQVDRRVARPVSAALAGMEGLVRLRSVSVQGLASITARFDPGQSLDRDREIVARHLAAARLAPGTGPPRMMPTVAPDPVLTVGLVSATSDLMTLGDIARHTLGPRFLAVPGVARLTVSGGGRRAWRIEVLPDRLIRFRIGFDQVLAAARRATGMAGAGSLVTPNQRIVLDSRGQAADAASLAGIVVRPGPGGTAVTLGEVARVVAAPLPAAGAVAIMGRRGIRIAVYEHPGADTLAVGRRLAAILAQAEPSLARAGVRLYPDPAPPARRIAAERRTLKRAAAMGGLLAAAAILLILFDLPAALGVLAEIAVTVSATLLGLVLSGAGLTLITLGGLAAALILVVVRAVDGEGEPVLAALAAALPLILAGPWAGTLAASFAGTLLVSGLVALTVKPALAHLLPSVAGGGGPGGPVVRAVPGGWPLVAAARRYRRWSRRMVERPRLAAALLVLLSSAAILPLALRPVDPLPPARPGHLTLRMDALPGTSIAQSLALGRRVTAALTALAPVALVVQRVGRSDISGPLNGSWTSLFDLALRPGRHADLTARMRAALADVPGVRFRMGRGAPGPSVRVVLTGHDAVRLARVGRRIAGLLRTVPGIGGVRVQTPPVAPRLTIRLRPADLRRSGIEPVEVLDAVADAIAGRRVGTVYRGDRTIPVTVQMAGGAATSPAALAALPVRNGRGRFVRLGQLADIVPGQAPTAIHRLNGMRVLTLTVAGVGRDPATGAAAAQAAIEDRIGLPADMGVTVEGGDPASLGGHAAILAVLAILAILAIAAIRRAGGFRPLLLALAGLPAMLAGGAAVVAFQGGLSPGAAAGLAALLGLGLGQALCLFARYRRLVTERGMEWEPATAVQGALDRFAPLVTAVAVGAALLLPLAALPAPGADIVGAAAAVVLGGLVPALAVTLFLLPALALRWGGVAARTERG